VKKVSILVLTFNRVKTTEKYLPMIVSRLGNIDAEVLVWDNGSTDGTYDWLENFGLADCRVAKVFGSDTNYGMEAINFLAEKATGQYLLKIDDDVFPPEKYGERLVRAYEEVNEEKLAFLSWDMIWASKTFATRSGLKLYKAPYGKIVPVDHNTHNVYISFDNNSWLVNGICRLSPRNKFLEIGGHPKGIRYGVDYLVTKAAKKHGYWVGFYSPADMVHHMSPIDTPSYRKIKDDELQRHGAPRHV
jgi:glycosyltransferase involved in cell wall biosynthesis